MAMADDHPAIELERAGQSSCQLLRGIWAYSAYMLRSCTRCSLAFSAAAMSFVAIISS